MKQWGCWSRFPRSARFHPGEVGRLANLIRQDVPIELNIVSQQAELDIAFQDTPAPIHADPAQGKFEDVKPEVPPPSAEHAKPPDGIIPICSGGCDKTTEGMTHETASGKFTPAGDGGPTVWISNDCLAKQVFEGTEATGPGGNGSKPAAKRRGRPKKEETTLLYDAERDKDKVPPLAS